MSIKQEDQDTLLHLLRNPDGWSDEVIRDARQKAANELERLWKQERTMKHIALNIGGALTAK